MVSTEYSYLYGLSFLDTVSTMIYSMQILYKTVQFHFSRDVCRLAVDCVYVKCIVR
jgi:hypothetical protein